MKHIKWCFVFLCDIVFGDHILNPPSIHPSSIPSRIIQPSILHPFHPLLIIPQPFYPTSIPSIIYNPSTIPSNPSLDLVSPRHSLQSPQSQAQFNTAISSSRMHQLQASYPNLRTIYLSQLDTIFITQLDKLVPLANTTTINKQIGAHHIRKFDTKVTSLQESC